MTLTRRLPAATLAAFAMLLAPLAAAAANPPPCLVLTNGNALLPVGEQAIPAVDIHVAGDRIVAVGTKLPVPAGCERVDVVGKRVTPGLIDLHTQLGLVEVGLEASTVDRDQKASYQVPLGDVRAAVRTELGFNPRSSLIPIARLGGLTSAVSVPQGGVIAGQSLWADLTGGSRAAAIQRAPAAMHASVAQRSGSRATAFHTLDLALREAAVFTSRRGDWRANKLQQLLTPYVDLEAMAPVAAGELPLVVKADRAADIEALLAMTKDSRVNLVISGAAEGWLVADALAARRVPVVLYPLQIGVTSFDSLHARPDNAALLHAAGVSVAISSFSSHSARKLRQIAANAVREGLDYTAAIDAITKVPAEALGMADHGRIAPGAVANLAVWSGDPLEIATRLELLVVHGVRVPLVSRQTKLFQRYRTLPRQVAPVSTK